MPSSIIPAPISWTPSQYWDGNDGSWNSFIVQVGTPAQDFRILPSTEGHETWVPVPDGCTSREPSDPGYCGNLRGALPINGVNSSGFETTNSSTWQEIGIYTLDQQESNLGYGGNGLYGFDTVVWGNASDSPSLTRSVVAGIADPDFWLGRAGIGPKSSNFTNFTDPIPSFLDRLVNDSKIPSLSWGYTAGASYRNEAPASLTLGGYDTDRFESPGLSIEMASYGLRPLQVAVQKIVTQNSLIGTANLLPTAIYEFIDSTVSQLWLPSDAISQFVDAFGLTYDNDTDLYLVNDTIHAKLLQMNPTITFVLASSISAGVSSTINIDFPYGAFDLNATYPFYQNATRYFPIRQAANNTQYTIGRTFLQEAYVIADYGRQNFTVAQAVFPTDTALRNLVAILQPPATSSLTTGDKAGIAIGAIAAVATVALLTWFLLRRRAKKRRAQTQEHADNAAAQKLDDYKDGPHEENELQEVEGEYDPLARRAEVDGQNISEMEGQHPKWSRYGVQELHTPPLGNLSEVPGSDGVRYELAAEPFT